MKLIKTASGKQTIKMSKKEWQDLGKTAGWITEAQFGGDAETRHSFPEDFEVSGEERSRMEQKKKDILGQLNHSLNQAFRDVTTPMLSNASMSILDYPKLQADFTELLGKMIANQIT